MGIVAYCPNGHRIKVKDRLAGKRGLCPTCGAKFRIPRPEAGGAAGHLAAADLPEARVVPLDPAVVATLPLALPRGSGRPAAAATPAVAAVIAERPDLQWCIALHGGPPSAPLDGSKMQAWLAGGQATGRELVWRADWPEWRSVTGVFPEFFPGS